MDGENWQGEDLEAWCGVLEEPYDAMVAVGGKIGLNRERREMRTIIM